MPGRAFRTWVSATAAERHAELRRALDDSVSEHRTLQTHLSMSSMRLEQVRDAQHG
jgi:hypothetical protein